MATMKIDLSDVEQNLIKSALKAYERSVKVSIARSGIPLAVQAMEKELAMVAGLRLKFA